MSKHTQGPWKVTEDARVFSESAREWNRTFNANTPAFIAACSGNAANARLIAAAPDLLEAAVLATGYVQASIDMATSPDFKLAATDALAKLRAALAAARGEA
jgi:hypothetical protein